MHWIHRIAVVAALGLFGACGTDYEVTDQPLAGTVGASPWTFVKGYTDSFLSDDEDFFAVLYPTDVEACGWFPPGMDHLIVALPTTPGEYGMSLHRNMTYVVYDEEGPNNLIATEGVIVVESIDVTTVKAGLHSKFDGGNEVDGTFEIEICPDT